MNPITDPDKFEWVMACSSCMVHSTYRLAQTDDNSVVCNSCGAFASRTALKENGYHELKEEFKKDGLRRVGPHISIDRKTGAMYSDRAFKR